MNTEAETGVVLPQARDHLGPPEAGGSMKAFFPRAFTGNLAQLTPQFWISKQTYLTASCYPFVTLCVLITMSALWLPDLPFIRLSDP